MTRKYLTAAVVAIATLGGTASAASAHRAWTNTAGHVENQLLDRWHSSDGAAIVEASCRGASSSFYGWHHGKRWYHRFTCNAWDEVDRHIGLRVTVTGPLNLRVIQTWCNDSLSDYYCP